MTTMKLRERNMDNDMKGLEVGNFHKNMEAYANELGIKTKVYELKERLIILKEMLQERTKEDHRSG
jgi:hypothetical protein